MKPRSRKNKPKADPSAYDDSVREEIARKAYERFQSRGASHGYHFEDWVEAEREVLGRLNADTEKKVRPVKAKPRTRRKNSAEDQPNG